MIIGTKYIIPVNLIFVVALNFNVAHLVNAAITQEHQSKAQNCCFCSHTGRREISQSWQSHNVQAAITTTRKKSLHFRQSVTGLHMGWFDDLFQPYDPDASDEGRRLQYPEQYPATYELLTPEDVNIISDGSGDDTEELLVRPLLKQTQLERRPLKMAYDATRDGWSAEAFHRLVDGRGASVVMAKTEVGGRIGGYNPKGWASMGGARPSVAAFLFYSDSDSKDCGSYQKLQKVGGGGLACAFDDPDRGIFFGPDSLVIPLQPGKEKVASSKLGPYYEKGPQELSSLFSPSSGSNLLDLKVFVGIYESGEEIPYSGAVLDMTSG